MIDKNCEWCGKKFSANRGNQKYCSILCRDKKNDDSKKSLKTCKMCSKTFRASRKHVLFCGMSCSMNWREANPEEVYEKGSCKECGDSYYKKSYKNEFCSNECSASYYRKHKAKKVSVICSNCGKQYDILKTYFKRKKTHTFYCSKTCESIHKSGENHPNYNHDFPEEDRHRKCEQCGKEYRLRQLRNKDSRFCSISCSMKEHRGTFSSHHKKIAKILNKNRLWNEIEKKVGRYSLDCFLGKGLGIEVMGSYWHGDIRIYPKARDKIQKGADKRDKRKKAFLKNKGITVLYIWEKDIDENPKMCEKLILEFSKTNGRLGNFHSMNYIVDDGVLTRRDKIITPRFEK
jgi:very-short-patch-repair endonuclease